MEKKWILICGAGSIGVYLGARLHCDGHDVKIIGRRKLRKVKEKIVINKKIMKFQKNFLKFRRTTKQI